MESIRQVAKIYTENMHIANEYYSNGLNVDVVKARDLVYTDRIVTKLWWYDWNNRDMSQQTEDTSNHWTEKTFCAMPENIEWCDCHLDTAFNNKARKSLQTFQDIKTNEIFTSDLIQLSGMTNNFYHYDNDVNFYGRCNNMLYNDGTHEDDEPQNLSFKPRKKHLKVWWFDTYEGEREMVWFYPDDLVLRIDLNNYEKNTYPNIEDTSISSYDNYDFGQHYTYDRFVQEKMAHWTYNPDKPAVCDTCNGKSRLNQTVKLSNLLKDTFMYQSLFYSETIKRTCIMAKHQKDIDLTGLISDIAEIDDEYFDVLPRILRDVMFQSDDDTMQALIDNNRHVLRCLRKEFHIKARNPIITEHDYADFILKLKEKYLLCKSMTASDNIVEYFLENWFENPVKMPLLEENGRIKNTI